MVSSLIPSSNHRRRLRNHHHPRIKSPLPAVRLFQIAFALVVVSVLQIQTVVCSSNQHQHQHQHQHQQKHTHTTSTSTRLPPFHPLRLQYFLRSKCQAPLLAPTLSSTPCSSTPSTLIDPLLPPSPTPPTALWCYEGRLVDPATDRTVAHVQGLEVIQLVSECVPIGDRANPRSVYRTVRGLRRLGGLGVRKALMLSSSRAETGWDYAGTVLSRKLFCYTTIPSPSSDGVSNNNSNNNNNNNDVDGDVPSPRLLTTYRIHPTSPIRRLKTQESISGYDTATTYVSRNGGKDMAVVTEWPNGRWIRSDVSTTPASEGWKTVRAGGDDGNNGSSGGGGVEGGRYADIGDGSGGDGAIPRSFEYTSFSKQSPLRTVLSFPAPQPTSSLTLSLEDLPSCPASSSNDTKKGSAVVASSPPRSKFVQFGKDDSAERQRYGARETYSYVLGSPSSLQQQRQDSDHPIIRCVRRVGQTTNRAVQDTVFRIGERFRYYPLGLPPSVSSSSSSSSSSPSGLFGDGDGEDITRSKSCTLRYTRYGEGPPWYGIGRTCALELWGRRIDSLDEAPNVVKALVMGEERRVKGFLPDEMVLGAKKVEETSLLQTGEEKRGRENGKEIGKKEPSFSSLVDKRQRASDLSAIDAVDSFLGKRQLNMGTMARTGTGTGIESGNQRHPSLLPWTIEDEKNDDETQEGLQRRKSGRLIMEKLLEDGTELAHRVRGATVGVSSLWFSSDLNDGL